ncbi:MAG: dienelactone hydrolase family protein [Verrucomicrobiota bacterium]
MNPRLAWLGGVGVVAWMGLGDPVQAQAPRALPPGEVPRDVRLQPPKDLDGYFPFDPPATREEWGRRAEQVRRQILVSQGLWPRPTRTPLNPVIHGRVEREEYTVEKVYFESLPGFFVTGNLYRPRKVTGKAPAVLFAHGHWQDARLSEAGDAELRREIATGEERFEEGGRSRFQSMCVHLARMGCVVWQWDMLGDSDSQQLSRALVHGFAKQRPEMNTAEDWGLFSPPAEAHLQSVMGLQTWNAIRSLDFVLTLPEVDPARVAMTGASGGGTQTMLLAAVDPRVALSFPAVMVSTAMQGGCTCENACLLRVGTGNVEFAALFAPKPQGMTTANDWTKEMAAKGFPELQRLYALMGAPGQVMLHRGEHFPHNYNAVSRSAFYGWLNRHFQLGQAEPVLERDYARLKRAELTVWDAAHPAPAAADPAFERRLLRGWHDDLERQLAALQASSREKWREVVAPAVDVVLGRTLASVGEVTWDLTAKEQKAGWIQMSGRLRNVTHGEEVPAVFLYPASWNGHTAIWLTGSGKAGLYGAEGGLQPAVRRLVEAGVTVVGLDLVHQGEFRPGGTALAETPRVKNPREAAAYTLGYNRAVFAQRVHDVLGAIRFIQGHERKSGRVSLVAVDAAGPIAAAARAQAGNAVDRAAIHTGGFRFGRVTSLQSPDFLPGGARYGDVPGLLGLGVPGRLWLGGETPVSIGALKASYLAAGAAEGLTEFQGSPAEAAAAAADWLLR